MDTVNGLVTHNTISNTEWHALTIDTELTHDDTGKSDEHDAKENSKEHLLSLVLYIGTLHDNAGGQRILTL